MEFKKILLSIVLSGFTLGCDNRKTLKVTKEDINTLDSLGYKVYQYKKDKNGKYHLDSIHNKISDSSDNER